MALVLAAFMIGENSRLKMTWAAVIHVVLDAIGSTSMLWFDAIDTVLPGVTTVFMKFVVRHLELIVVEKFLG